MRAQRGTMVNLIGGLIGIKQDPDTKSLQPKAGWVIQRMDALEQVMERIHEDERCHDSPGIEAPTIEIRSEELLRFYERFASVTFFHYDGDNKSRYCELKNSTYSPLKRRADGSVTIARLHSGEWIDYREQEDSNGLASSYVLRRGVKDHVYLTNDLAELLEAIFIACKTNEPLRKRFVPV